MQSAGEETIISSTKQIASVKTMALSECLLIARCCCSNAPPGPPVVSSSLSVNYYKKEHKAASRPARLSRATETGMNMIVKESSSQKTCLQDALVKT